jgi:hypothetical protein
VLPLVPVPGALLLKFAPAKIFDNNAAQLLEVSRCLMRNA